MKTIERSSVMMALILGLSLLPAAGQSFIAGSTAKPRETGRFDIGITSTFKLAKIANTTGSSFGLHGGSVDGVYWLGDKAKNLGLAFDFNGETASNIKPGVDLSQFTFVAGPRYTLWNDKSKGHGANLFGEVLAGEVHAFNSVFPTSTAVTSSVNSFSLQAGGGFNLPLTKSLGLRLLEADYVLTKLPNGDNDLQSDLRLSAGIVFMLGVSAPRR